MQKDSVIITTPKNGQRKIPLKSKWSKNGTMKETA